jgi:hypothetical protein
MGLFDFWKSKNVSAKNSVRGSYCETEIQDKDLRALVNLSISVFQDNPDFEADQLIDKIISFSGEEQLALALYRFIPIAYCRLLFPEPGYSDEYILYKNDKQQSFTFSTDNIYRVVFEECSLRFSRETSQEKILPILVHSADFNAINEAVKGGAVLADMIVSPSYFCE